MNSSATDYLKTALTLAEIRKGFCAPNPCVGAILVKNDQIIAKGYHQASGSPHAEINAINKVDVSLIQGATLYVTLQPCCHIAKKTPPCTDLIIKSGILKVVYGFRDPNPAVTNYTDKILRDAGIECIHHPLALIDNFYVSYAFWWKHKRPFTTAKLAMSLDGKIAGENGKRIQLTGNIAQQFTHQQRKHTDAILTTAKTISLDNPLLNCRIDGNTYKKPLYILDTHLSTSISANVFNSAEPITIFHNISVSKKEQDRFRKYDIRFFPIKNNTNDLDLLEILKQIGQDGIMDLWIEAGGKSFQSFVQNNLLQHAFIYVSPIWLGENTQSAFTSSEPLKGALLTDSIILGKDICFEFKWSEH
ncbi:bifunctional diaminohydroxyphosphoribosylaminopyrimidine deaminase/5-amino-6-(5-phosphoribosylamino)uracil reductase RibD [Rickettsiella endosymbiont of Rhagonycha lignosa]|uniref:bifunctional diaminohydroxyphosphoribosylaminopyrimidine deaminase/5-amino-6-(5-phosphoribosylamino)uracil reductase RibD n=1 Tax=Rickettsiella endosymbiont of Rhagonycha lignosa TaxID=3077937 RepID=UPI00313DA39D